MIGFKEIRRMDRCMLKLFRFTAILKHRYSDFIVHEVRLDGSVVKLDNLQEPERHVPDKEAAWKCLKEMLSEETVAQLHRILVVSEIESLRLPTEGDKQRRKSIHDALKAFPVSTETATNGDGSKSIVLFRKKARSDDQSGSVNRKRRRNTDFPKGAYTSFVLYKENTDTNEAISRLSGMLRTSPKHFFFAGTKDKRAVTSQEMRIKGFGPSRLAALNKGLRSGQMALGNFSTAQLSEPLLLGQLSGNQFTILLRGIDEATTPETISQAVNSMKKAGFINYFGLQRFGGGRNPTHKVGIQLLAGNIRKAVEMILEPLDPSLGDPNSSINPKRAETNKALADYLAGNISASDAVEKIPQWMNVERTILSSYAQKGAEKDHRRAFGALPYTLRMMYMHAVQSYFWNTMATARAKGGRLDFAEEGDLVYEDRDGVETNAEATEQDDRPARSVRKVTAEEAGSNGVPIGDVVLPLIGEKVDAPGGPVGAAVKELVERLNIDLSKPIDKGLGFRAYGSYRRLIGSPKDVKYEIVRHETDDEEILLTDRREMSGERQGGGVGEKCALKIQFSLESAEYATMCLRELTKQESTALMQKTVLKRSSIE
ncbi:hypothetical protein NDN08_006845 [Rhodosorus marinus]|uniref:TRUD domain-containing protein n=1 Tax=Rhodosorus marinus TaxID=101924 RepID=A0AAV8UIU4_9RHOD|nr:hypothetical protein NDN08_006845 [Rhodosorus marinus]